MAVASLKRSETTSLLPLISIQALRAGDKAAIRNTANAIGEAAREIGFFRICDHGIDLKLIEATYRSAAQFFALSEETKGLYYIGDSPNHRGYVPFSEKGDYTDEVNRNYEAFDLALDLPCDDPDFLAGNRMLGPNVWPKLQGFKQNVARYYAHISEVGRLVASALELYLDLPEGAMTDHMRKPISQLRLLHYVCKSSMTAQSTVNMGAHTDYECLTLLHTRNPGLQVMTQDSSWIDVPVDPAALVVNIGDMLEAWSNGLLRSTPHRVLNFSAERYSLPYFVAVNYDTVIEPFAHLVSPENPAKYESFLAGAHMERMLLRDFPYLRAHTGADPASNPSSFKNPFEKRLHQDSRDACPN